jgi:hypothetical protein
MRSGLALRPHVTRSTALAVSTAALISAASLVGALAPQTSAATPAAATAASPAAPLPLPLPLPEAGAGPVVSEVGNIEGPLINTIALPTLK